MLTFSAPPQRCTFPFPRPYITFNREVAIDIMWIGKKPTLNVVDLETSFSATQFSKHQTVESVRNVFVTCWADLYIGFPMKVRVERGSSFTSVRFKRRADAVGMEFQESGVESHNSIRFGERYHSPLRRIHYKIIDEEPKIDRFAALQIAVKAMNDTMGPKGLVLSFLVFGCIPQFLFSDSQSRMNAFSKARKEIATT